MKTPSLFDEPETPPEPAPDAQDEASDELDDWQEVPQARFLSWSPAMQATYCRRRDLDSALRADNNEDAQFFLDRAKMYEAMIRHEQD